jgi:hypothetical protein
MEERRGCFSISECNKVITDQRLRLASLQCASGYESTEYEMSLESDSAANPFLFFSRNYAVLVDLFSLSTYMNCTGYVVDGAHLTHTHTHIYIHWFPASSTVHINPGLEARRY